ARGRRRTGVSAAPQRPRDETQGGRKRRRRRAGRGAGQVGQDLAGRLGQGLETGAKQKPAHEGGNFSFRTGGPCGRSSCGGYSRYLVGSTGVAFLRTSKCSFADSAFPVRPDLAICWPRRTVSPRSTSISLAWP